MFNKIPHHNIFKFLAACDGAMAREAAYSSTSFAALLRWPVAYAQEVAQEACAFYPHPALNMEFGSNDFYIDAA